MTTPEIVRHPSSEALAADVAERLVERLAAVQAEGRVPSVGLTGGTIAAAIHEALVAASVERVDWGRVDIWWGDERFVAGDDPDRNCRQAAESLLDHVAVSPERVHEMAARDDAGGADGDLERAAAAYGEEIRTQGNGMFDVLMLGVGPDGHVASLFPGFPQLDVDDAVAVPVTGSPKPPPERISLTFGALNHSRAVWFVVSGAGKADAVARALSTGPGRPDVHEIPAVGVSGQHETLWFLDDDAASRL
ncbi:MAG: 6-phosphogluconolactonase [Nocardioidaceae bacterium]